MYQGAADLLYFCTVMHFRYININIYTINFAHWLVFVGDWNEEKRRLSLCVTFQSVCPRSSLFLFLCCCLFDCFQFVVFEPLCFSRPNITCVHKPNTASYCCFWHLHWDKQPVLNGLNIWQYLSLSLSCLCFIIANTYHFSRHPHWTALSNKWFIVGVEEKSPVVD